MKIIRSNKYLEEYKKIIPGSKILNNFDPFEQKKTPFCFTRGKDAHVWDLDGNKYLDFHMSLGSIILGYSNKEVNKAAISQLKEGITFSLMHSLETKVASKLIKMIPGAEMVRFGKNGSDVLAAAVRLARYITKKDKVLSCGWHGIHDWSLANTSSNGGIPKQIKKLSIQFEFNNIDNLLGLIKKNKNDISCIVMDLCARYYPEKNYLKKVREIANKYKILLIFDEIITGFRMHPGGAQSYFNIKPDLSCFGKGIANGFPVSALVGKEKYLKKANDLFYSLTFAGETISLAAASAALDLYKNKKLSRNLEKKGNYLKDNILKVIDEQNLNGYIKIEGMPSRLIISLDKKILKNSKKDLINLDLIKNLAEQKILYNGSIFICNKHSYQNLDYFCKSFAVSLKKTKKKFNI